jgi:damage-control phosphatase, subfamily I
VRTWPDCVPCMLTMTMGVARRTMPDDEQVKALMESVVHGPLSEDVFQRFTPEVVRDIWVMVQKATGDFDPLRREKERQNRAALGLYPAARAYAEAAADPLLAVLKLCIGGNMLDAMVGVEASPAEAMLGQLDALAISSREVETLRRRLEGADRVVWFTDNCGEIVFDRLFLEYAIPRFDLKVTVVTKTVPTVNDATLADAVAVGLDRVADTVIENGILEPLPSTDMRKVSARVRALVEGADLVVSKGVDNYELLSEDDELAGKTTFLIHGKCRPMYGRHSVEPGGLIVSNY